MFQIDLDTPPTATLARRSRPLLSLVAKDYLDDTVARICKDSMNKYFPEIQGVSDTSLGSR